MLSLRGKCYAEAGRIGSGSFGCVVHVFDEDTGDELAAKVFESTEDAEMPADALREISFMRMLTDAGAPCIAPVLDVAFELSGSPELVAIMPLYARDLSAAIDTNDLGVARLSVMRDVLRAFAYLHGATPAIVHRDMKPENVLLDAQNGAFLTDFSLARFVTDGRAHAAEQHHGGRRRKAGARPSTAQGAPGNAECSGVMGTPTYIAPEVFDEVPPSPAADLWALGVTFLELCEGARLPVDRDKAAIRLVRQKRDALSSSRPLPAMIASMLDDVPQRRLSAEGALSTEPFKRDGLGRTATPLVWSTRAKRPPPPKQVMKACRDVLSDVPHVPCAAQHYLEADTSLSVDMAVIVASKIYEHDVLPDYDMLDALVGGGDIGVLAEAQRKLLRTFDGNLLAPYDAD